MNYFFVVLIMGMASVPAVADEIDVSKSLDQQSAPVENGLSKRSPIANHIFPTGILPKGLLVPYYALHSENISERYQSNGQKESMLGLKAKGKANVVGVQYGLTNSITLTLVAPFITHSEVKINDYSKLRASQEYAAVQAYSTSQLADGFVQAGMCSDSASCYSQIANGMTFPVSNAEAGYSAGMPVASYIGAVADGYFQNNTQKEGTQAMGDLRVGMHNQYFQKGALTIKSRTELTLPTGKYDVAADDNATGEGRYTIQAYGNAEYALHKGMLTIFEHGVGYDLTSAKADGVKSRYEGVGQRSGAYLLFDPGQYIEPLKFVALSTSYNVAYNPSQSQKSDTAGDLGNKPQSQISYNINTVRFSAINYGFPLLLDMIKQNPLSGKNINAKETNTIVITTMAPI